MIILKHLVDIKPRLAECNRCHEYVFAGMQSGCRYALDISPLNAHVSRALLIGGVDVYSLHRGRTVAFVTPNRTAMPQGDGWTYHQAHGCGCSALDASAFEELPVPPLQAPAMDSGTSDVLAGRGWTYSVVTDARPHRSDVVRCHECGVLMGHDDEKIMIEWPVWQENTHKVPNRGSRKGYTREYKGWGTERWAIHPDGCPVPTSG